MTVQDVLNFIDYVGNGAQTSFTFVFRADDVSWVGVSFTTDIIGVTLNADQDTTPGGTVDYTVAPPNLQDIRIQRVTPQAQNLDYTRYDPFDSESHEDALDKLTMEVQDLAQSPDRVGLVATLASTANGDGASTIGVEDAAGFYTATTVEGILAEIPLTLAVEKPNNELTDTDTVLSDDSDLIIPLLVGTWYITGTVYFGANVNGGMGLKWKLNYPGSISRTRLSVVGMVNGAVFVTSTPFSVEINHATIIVGATPLDFLTFSGIIVVTGADILAFQWAQNSSDANNLNINNASSLIATKIA